MAARVTSQAEVERVEMVAARAALRVIDEEYSGSVAEIGFAASLGSYVDESARFYRNGHLPFLGVDTVSVAPPVIDAAWTGWDHMQRLCLCRET